MRYLIVHCVLSCIGGKNIISEFFEPRNIFNITLSTASIYNNLHCVFIWIEFSSHFMPINTPTLNKKIKRKIYFRKAKKKWKKKFNKMKKAIKSFIDFYESLFSCSHSEKSLSINKKNFFAFATNLKNCRIANVNCERRSFLPFSYFCAFELLPFSIPPFLFFILTNYFVMWKM